MINYKKVKAHKTIIVVSMIVTIFASGAIASFSDSLFSGNLHTVSPETSQTSAVAGSESKTQTANPEDFKHWLGNYNGATDAEKAIVIGMMENDANKAKKHFQVACEDGDERGCFQLALNEISQGEIDGLDRLKRLGINGKNKDISTRSAQFLGAYILDFAPKNKKALSEALEAVLPHAVNGDADSQFLAANIFLSTGMLFEADNMLNKVCNNTMASKKIIQYCQNGENIEVVAENGEAVGVAKKEAGTCGSL